MGLPTVAIAGAGAIGGAAARALALSGLAGRVLLIDDVRDGAEGTALDLQQSGAIERFHAHIEGTNDSSRAVGCGVCVVADRFAGGEWSGDEALAMLTRTAPYLGDAPIIFAGASQTDLLAKVAAEAGIDRRRLIGSATVALASAVAAMAAVEARCAPGDVMVSVFGVPPSGFVVPWSEASVGGLALEQVLSPVQIGRIEARVARIWPPGPFGLGTAAARAAESVLAGSRRTLCVLTWLTGEYGVRNRPGTVQARLAPTGIAEIRAPELTVRERVRLQTALGA
jgi:malate/lactate dehydrogenase